MDIHKERVEDTWHACEYRGLALIHDGSWVSGKWYEWKDKYGRVEVARMKADCADHFWPRPKKIREEDVVAFRSLTLV